MNKGNVIEIRCKKCNKLMMEYFVCGDDFAVALQNIGIKCDRCKRVMILKPNDREYAMSTCLIFIEGLEARKEVV
mgnify:CR=1 FL=1